ncbi:MAG: hypothetical protein CMD33_07775 [Flavobacteriales bacterium]|nr:hypothetical protein [Flavobacteriales bacterium]
MKLPVVLLKFMLILLCAQQATEGLAAHLMGGEVGYEYVGDGNFLVTVIQYRDCSADLEPGSTSPEEYCNNFFNLPGNFDDAISVAVFENGICINNLSVDFTELSCEPVETVLENPCGNLPDGFCMQRIEYSTIVNLPPSSFGYELVFQRCCRNPGIANIVNNQQGITLTTQIPPYTGDADSNSSPTFNAFPPEGICTNFDFFLDQSATDPDGDSLVYSLCTPFDGGTADAPAPQFNFGDALPPINPISWSDGFSATAPIPSASPFQIDTGTGQIIGFPITAGAYVVGICVAEYRDGVLLSTVMRDFQFNVVTCDPTIISAVQPQTDNQLCIGETIGFGENSIGAQSLLWDFGVPGIDTDVSTLSNPMYTYPDTGVYTVTLIANPTWPCADTSSQVFYVYEPLDLDVEVIDFECLNGVEAFDLQANGAFTANTNLTWTLIGGLPDTQEGLTTDWVTFGNADEWTVTLEAEHFGCESSVNFAWDAPASPVAAVADQSSFCQGFDFDFENLSQNGENWLWDFGVPGTNEDTSVEESPSYTYPGDGLYTVELIVTSAYTCSDTAYSTVEIFPEIDPAFEAPDPECFSTNNFFLMPLVENDPITTYNWDFGGETVSANVNGATVSNLVYAEPGTYTVEVTAIANGCEVTAAEEVWVIADPSIGFQGGPPIGCPPHSVSFSNMSETETATTYLWDFGDGTTSISADPVHVYENSGTYSVTLTMNSTGYCNQELILTQTELINVQATPTAGFNITPNQVDVLNPVIEFETLATGNVLCFYNFGDGGSSGECSGTYTYSDGGLFDVVQTVVNEAGCSNTAVGQVAVSGTVFYAPNAFTPDQDGLNDVWLPIALGVSEYRLAIYDRWGALVWETDTQDEPWLGQVQDGAHFAPDGIYYFKAVISDLLALPHTYQGHLQLLR